MHLIDAHIHIDFYNKPNDIINEFQSRSITAVYVTHLPEIYKKYYERKNFPPNVKLALGYHPILINEYKFKSNIFTSCKDTTKFIGEVGLDYSITKSEKTRSKQRDVFNYICSKCKNHIISIHAKQSEKDAIDILEKNNIEKAIFHWYSGSIEQLKRVCENGYYFSVNPAMLRTSKGKNIINSIPKDLLLIETDGPFIKYNKEIVKPHHLFDIYNNIGTFLSHENLNQIVNENFNRLISKSI